MSYEYDVAVIGGGPGGYVAAIKAAQQGRKTILFEKEQLGGACLNVGCIPTKALLRSVEVLNQVQEATRFGVAGLRAEAVALDMAQVQKRKQQVVSQLVGGVKGLLKAHQVEVVMGEARLEDAHTVCVTSQPPAERRVTAQAIILATGSEPKTLAVPIDSAMPVLTSRELLALTQIPPAVVIIGGGAIGIEFAYFLAEAGAKVTVVEFRERILPLVDEEISALLSKDLEKRGITIHTGAQVTEIGRDYVAYAKAGEAQRIPTELVLMAVGRVPVWRGIPVEELGIHTEQEAIVTDADMRTSVANIYAIGDVNGKSMLAHTASREATVAVAHICGEKSELDYRHIPSCVYTQPEIASVGLTEAQARQQYQQIQVGRFPLGANGKAKVAGEERGLVKVITDGQFGEILGVHLYCLHATDLIAEAVAAMQLEGTAAEMAQVVHPHPTVSEVLGEAFHSALGHPLHAF